MRTMIDCLPKIGCSIGLIAALLLLTPIVQARDLSLDEAIEIALNKTSRATIIQGRREVAEQNYRAKRINFLLPEISINGSLPSYAVDERFRFFGGATQKQLYKTRDISFNSFVELKQSLLTGGTLRITANLTADDSRYPDTRNFSDTLNVNETSRQGFFNFELDQPLFRPSETKKELYDRRDDMNLARLTQLEEEASLRKEVTEAYMGLLESDLTSRLQKDKLRSARLQATIDSSKFSDGIVSEETWLIAESDLLDAELEQVEAETEAREKVRELASLLDFDVTEKTVPTVPTISSHFDAAGRERLIAAWENSVSIRKAEYEYEKSVREAKFSAVGNGVTGDLRANYSLGKGNVETEFDDVNRSNLDDDINTRGWGISLNFRVPVWDGGAGDAAVKASRFKSDQARLELERARKEARSAIVSLVNDLDVGYRRLDVIRRQIELANSRLGIAKIRYDDGQISKISYLGANSFYLEQKNRYLQEVKKYLINRIDLDGKIISF